MEHFANLICKVRSFQGRLVAGAMYNLLRSSELNCLYMLPNHFSLIGAGQLIVSCVSILNYIPVGQGESL